VNGVRDALQTLASLQHISHCQVAGILPTFYERSTAESHLQLTHLATTFGQWVLLPFPGHTLRKQPASGTFGNTLRPPCMGRVQKMATASGWEVTPRWLNGSRSCYER